MDLAGLLVFAGVYFLAVASPGPGIAAIVARSLSTGFRRTVPFVLGVASADLIWLSFSALGLTLLMQSFHGLFLAIKYAGCAYLIYLAWKLWTAPVKSLENQPAMRGEGVRLFLGGVALTLGNPKVMVFFVSILPLVVDLQALTPLAFVEVAVLTMLIINATLLGYAYAADRARRLVASPRTMRRINRVTGGVMAGAAAAIAARG
ncbi:MAG: LysE family translocator [Bosea sp.]|uniref:LysE family translocator n=1 Tax=Bosea sp. (in: a-proteobacteria) TaxID=1871050 RepID=UPI002383980F|nr:LysE family translocator [Bosea sp. (in: a-proteobacteria)]MCP4737225.1 LysE family translocator [Bosea sp. (in: a-proteobacteria)]